MKQSEQKGSLKAFQIRRKRVRKKKLVQWVECKCRNKCAENFDIDE